MSGDIRGEDHPPVVYIGNILLSVLLDLRDTKLNFFTDSRFPILEKIRAAERPRQKLSPRAMLPRINHSEDPRFREVRKALVPFALEILGTDLVDLLERIEVGHGDFVRRDTDHRPVLLVKRVDVE